MTQLLRILNAFYAALFLVMALVSLAFLSAGRDGFGGGPGGRWVSAGWAALFALLAILAFLNLRRAAAGRERLSPSTSARRCCWSPGPSRSTAPRGCSAAAAALPFALTALVRARRP